MGDADRLGRSRRPRSKKDDGRIGRLVPALPAGKIRYRAVERRDPAWHAVFHEGFRQALEPLAKIGAENVTVCRAAKNLLFTRLDVQGDDRAAQPPCGKAKRERDRGVGKKQSQPLPFLEPRMREGRLASFHQFHEAAP